ncbi:MAG TPA: YdcF family protein [Candidatus Competibacter sp.]|nr:YdcF family protein [Candidatus Competibacter sp.]
MLFSTKVLGQLAYPLFTAWLLAAAAGILLWRNRRRTGGVLLAIALGWLWLWSTPAFSDWVRATLEQRYPPIPVEELPVADAIVVLGGGMEAAKPPERLYPDLNAAADRIWHTARLFRAGKAPLILVSGGNLPWSGVDRTEAEVMAELLQELGVPKAAIALETRSRTTQENRDNALPVLRGLGARRILLVTSALHMPRALALFAVTDLAVLPAPTDFEVHRRTWNLLRWLPDAQALADSSRAFKEYLGRFANRLLQPDLREPSAAGG